MHGLADENDRQAIYFHTISPCVCRSVTGREKVRTLFFKQILYWFLDLVNVPSEERLCGLQTALSL